MTRAPFAAAWPGRAGTRGTGRTTGSVSSFFLNFRPLLMALPLSGEFSLAMDLAPALSPPVPIAILAHRSPRGKPGRGNDAGKMT